MMNTSEILDEETVETLEIVTNLTSDHDIILPGNSTDSQDSLGNFLYSLEDFVSPFTLIVVGSGIFFSLLLSLGFCLVCRINSRSPVKTELNLRASVRSENWSGRFELRGQTQTVRSLQESQSSSVSSSSTIRRNPSFSTPYCLSSRSGQPAVYSVMSPVTSLATPASLATTYPVVTPSTTTFSRPTPANSNYSSLFPAPAHSNYCTAGLYQTRLRSPPRPLSCIAGLGGEKLIEIPKVKISSQAPGPARLDKERERDYMSIAELAEHPADTTGPPEENLSRRRNSVYI